MRNVLRIFLWALFAAAAAGLLDGCATDTQPISPIPWDKSQPGESPMPPGINQGR